MGGKGSGRRPDPVKKLLGFNQPAKTDGLADVYIPNYSGMKTGLKKIEEDDPWVTDHSELTNLNWAAAGHTIDTDFDLNGNLIKSSISIKQYPSGSSSEYFRTYSDGSSIFIDAVNSSGGMGCGNTFFPSATNAKDLGSSSLKWKDLYLSGDANIGTDANITGDCYITDVKLEDTGDNLKITPDPAKTTTYWNIEADEFIASTWWVPTMSGSDSLFGNILAIKDRLYIVNNTTPQLFFSNRALSATARIEYNAAADRLDFMLATSYKFDNEITVADNIHIQCGTTVTDMELYSDGTNGIIDVATAMRLGNNVTNYTEVSSTGDIVMVGSAGLPYGEISATDNSTATTISVAGTAVQVTIFDTDGPSNNTTPDHTNDHITITKAGHYLTTVTATVNSIAGAGSRMELTLRKNNGATTLFHVHRTVSGGGSESASVSISQIGDFAVNDTIEVWIENETNTQNYVVEDIHLQVVQVGGT